MAISEDGGRSVWSGGSGKHSSDPNTQKLGANGTITYQNKFEQGALVDFQEVSVP